MFKITISPKYDYLTQEELESLADELDCDLDDLMFKNGFIKVYINEIGMNIYVYIEREGISIP